MKIIQSSRGATSLQVGVAMFVVLIILSVLTIVYTREDSNWLRTAMENSMRKTRLVQAMKSDLLASAEAEKSAVMADTDEASKAFAEQSVEASNKVDRELAELKELTRDNEKETKLVSDFNSCREKLRGIDKEILSLAVENTNLKAMRLSFGPAASAIRRMETDLNRVTDSAKSSPNAAEITLAASRALTGAFNIYMLEAPHIAESTEAGMDRIEAEMKQSDDRVREALNKLEGLTGESEKSSIAEVRKSYGDLQAANSEIITLSRRNSNIRSFTVSLGQKRNAMAQCIDLLNALQTAAQEGMEVKATR